MEGKKDRGTGDETPAVDALIGEEEQTGKKEENKERNRDRVSNLATLDTLVASYDPQESYGKPILVTLPPCPTGRKCKK